MKQLQYGIVSTASIVPRFVRAVQETPHSTVRAIASRSLDKAQAMASELGIPLAYASYQQLYEDDEIDVVYIATPNGDHYEQVKTALLAGKHVVCEKPFVLQSKQVMTLFALAQQQQCFLMEAQKAVFLPVANRLKQLIQSGTLGALKQIDITQSYVDSYPRNHWMHNPKQGGILFGSASYPIQWVMHLLDLTQLDYQVNGTKAEGGWLEAIDMSFVVKSSILVSARLSMNVSTNNMAYLYFEDGYVAIPEFWKARRAMVHHRTDDRLEEWSFPCLYEMKYEVDHVWECIHAKRLVSDVMTPRLTEHCIEVLTGMHAMLYLEK